MIFLRVLQLFVHPLIKEQRMLFFHKYIFDWILHKRLVECMSINGNNGRMIFCLAERMRSECGANAERMRSEPSTTKPTKTTDNNPIKSIVYKFSANIRKK